MEVLHDKTLVVLYLKKLSADQQCFTVEAFRTSIVYNLKPMPVKVYEYYGKGELLTNKGFVVTRSNIKMSKI